MNKWNSSYSVRAGEGCGIDRWGHALEDQSQRRD